MTAVDLLPPSLILTLLVAVGWLLFFDRRTIDSLEEILYPVAMTPETRFVYEHPRAPWLRSDGDRLLCRRCKIIEGFELDLRGIDAATAFVAKHETCPAPAVAA